MPGYLVKAANFVAEIANDDELIQLAEVDTIKKDTKIRVLPDKEWVLAKTIPILRKVWGLDPTGKLPAKIKPVGGGIVPVGAGSAPVSSPKLPPRLETVVDSRAEIIARAAAKAAIDKAEEISEGVKNVHNEAKLDEQLYAFEMQVTQPVEIDITETKTALRTNLDELQGNIRIVSSISNAIADAIERENAADERKRADVEQDGSGALSGGEEIDTTSIQRETVRSEAPNAGTSQESASEQDVQHETTRSEVPKAALSQNAVDERHGLGSQESGASASGDLDARTESLLMRMRNMADDEYIEAAPNEVTYVMESSLVRESMAAKARAARDAQNAEKLSQDNPHLALEFSKSAMESPLGGEDSAIAKSLRLQDGEAIGASGSVDSAGVKAQGTGRSSIPRISGIPIEQVLRDCPSVEISLDDIFPGQGLDLHVGAVSGDAVGDRGNGGATGAADESENSRHVTARRATPAVGGGEAEKAHSVSGAGGISIDVSEAIRESGILMSNTDEPSTSSRGGREVVSPRGREAIDEVPIDIVDDQEGFHDVSDTAVTRRHGIALQDARVSRDDRANTVRRVDARERHEAKSGSHSDRQLAAAKTIEAARAAVDAARQYAENSDGSLDSAILDRVTELVEALERAQCAGGGEDNPIERRRTNRKNNSRNAVKSERSMRSALHNILEKATNIEENEDDSPSEQFKVRRATDVLPHILTGGDDGRRAKFGDSISVSSVVDDEIERLDEHSDVLKIQNTSALRHMLRAEARAAASQEELQLAPTQDLSTKDGLRTLFEKEDELHLYLANEIREKESQAEREQSQEDDAVLSKKSKLRKEFSSLQAMTDEMPVINERAVVRQCPARDEKTNVAVNPSVKPMKKGASPMTFDDPFFKDRLMDDEQPVAIFSTFYLTTHRIWNVASNGGDDVKNCEVYDIENVQGSALHEERKFLWVIIDIALIVITGLYYVFMVRYMEHSTISLIVFLYGFLMLPVCYYMSFYTVLQINIGSAVLKSKCHINRENKSDAMMFLNRIEAVRNERRKELSK